MSFAYLNKLLRDFATHLQNLLLKFFLKKEFTEAVYFSSLLVSAKFFRIEFPHFHPLQSSLLHISVDFLKIGCQNSKL